MRSLALIGGLAGLTGALLYLAGTVAPAAAPLLIGLGPLPFFIAVLGWGNIAGLIAAATACLCIFAGALIGSDLGAVPALAGVIGFALTAIGPALWLSHLALLRRHMTPAEPGSPLEWYPLGRLLLWLTGMTSAGYLAVEALAYASTGAGLSTAVARYFEAVATPETRSQLITRIGAPDWPTVRDLVGRVVPAMGGISWQIWIAANGIGAYSLLAATGHCPRPGTGWHGLSLPRAYAVPFLLALGIGLTGHMVGLIGATLAAILFVPYFFLGLSVVHAIPLKGPGRVALLGLFYFLLLLLAWPAILVGILGFLEQWSGLRVRLLRGGGREDK